MIEAVGRHGYSGTTLRELVRLAGVSKSTFYEHFESKQEAFLATSDAVLDRIDERVAAACAMHENYRERLSAALSTFADIVVEHPQESNLVIAESLTLGGAGLATRERVSAIFEGAIRDCFEQSPSDLEVSDLTVRAIGAGIRGVVYRHLRDGTADELSGLVGELTEYALCYQQPDTEGVAEAAAAAARPRPASPDATAEELGWEEPPDSARSRAKLTQRERIVRAAGRLVVEKGFDILSIPAISGAAGTSNQTFYEYFDNKREAFLAAFDVKAAEALLATRAAFDDTEGGGAKIGAALRAMLEYIAANEVFARFTFFDLPTAGPVALDHADSTMESFAAFLRPELAPKELDAGTSDVVLQAIVSGAWSVIQHELARNQSRSLPELAPELARIVLMPVTALPGQLPVAPK
jgi:AcrR family transcriptional regulator